MKQDAEVGVSVEQGQSGWTEAVSQPLARRALLHWAIGLIGALLLLTAGGWALGWQTLWAFSMLTFLPWPLRLALALALLIITILGYRRTSGLLSRIPYPASRIPPPLWIAPAGLLFWLSRERTWHGDALYKLQLLGSQSLRSDPYVWKEPLDSVLSYGLAGLVQGWGWPPEHAIAALSILAGMAYVAAVGYLATVWSTARSQRATMVIALLALGSSQLWFGHIENYSLVTAATFWGIALAVGYLRGHNRLWPVGLVAGLAISLHPQAAFALPALLWLLQRPGWPRQLVTLGISGLIVPVLTVVMMRGLGVPWPAVGGGYAGDPQLFLTPAQALAPAQLADALNNLWLLAPLAPLWLVMGLWALSQPRLRGDRTFRYLTILAAGLLAYHFAFQNDLPRPRDWDLFAIVGPGVTLWGVYAWQGWLAHANPKHDLTVGPALAFALLFTASWIGLNHSMTLVRPHTEQRDLYARYRLLDLTTVLEQATVTPPEPICAEPSGCERVALTAFTMPQDGDTRPTIFAHAPARIALPLQVPNEAAFLWLSPALDPAAWGWGGDGVTFQVAVEQAGAQTLLWSRHLTPATPADLDWQEALIPLDGYRSQSVTLLLITEPGPANNNAADRAGWGQPWLMRGTPDRRFDR
jgi:hypothetical protein